jgi:predicted RND superfamily exporter protein
VKRLSKALARFIERRPWWIVILAIVLVAIAVPGITMLRTETGFNALVSPDSEISQDNSRYEAQFGGEPITILLSGQLDDTFSADNIAILFDFEREFSSDTRYRAITGPVNLLQIALEEADRTRQAFWERPGSRLLRKQDRLQLQRD